MVKQAYRQNLLQKNLAAEVRTIQGNAKKKDTLTLEEIKKLSRTRTESDAVKRAFLFSCMTGLRWADVSIIKWSNINISAKYLTVEQSKTEREVRINLNDSAIKLLNKPGEPDQKVFDLPTANGANKTLKAWIKRAGIEKNHVA